MDTRLILAHLAEAERHVLLSERHVARQIEIIEDLEHGGHPTQLAVELLATFETLQTAHIGHRDQIRKTLQLILTAQA